MNHLLGKPAKIIPNLGQAIKLLLFAVPGIKSEPTGWKTNPEAQSVLNIPV